MREVEQVVHYQNTSIDYTDQFQMQSLCSDNNRNGCVLSSVAIYPEGSEGNYFFL